MKTIRVVLSALSFVALSAMPVHAQTDEQSPAAPEGELPLDELRIFADVFNHIRQAYVEELDDKELLELAIRGMLEGLDPHSAYLDEETFGDLQVNTTGEFGGLGLEVGMEEGLVKVIAPIDDTPAHRAGIESGDLIIKLDGQSVRGLSLTDAINRMRGPRGSKIELTILREGVRQPFDVKLTRDIIKVVSVRSRVVEPGYAYVRIAQFQANTGQEFRDALQKLATGTEPLKGVVVDLRNNPGGILQASVEVVDAILDSGMIVYTEGRIANSHTSYEASTGDMLNGTPVIVLINGGSASAAEIVAGALQDHRRAVIMGTDSFGKGSVQTVVPISETRAIKLTTARYFTPNGRSIQAQGIEPDIAVERARLEALPEQQGISEADLQRHLSNGNGASEGKKPKAPGDSLLTRDNQLYEAISLLKGLNIMGRREPPAAPAKES